MPSHQFELLLNNLAQPDNEKETDSTHFKIKNYQKPCIRKKIMELFSFQFFFSFSNSKFVVYIHRNQKL